MRESVRAIALSCSLFAAASFTAAASAQPAAAAAAPPAAPAAPATPPARLVLTPPPGFEKVTVGGHTALCEPNDKKWVTQALADVKPATRPTTMPVDLLKRVTAARDGVLKQMVADLALGDDKAVAPIFDRDLIPTLTKVSELRPPVFFLVLTHDRFKEVARGGWGAPWFRYNRLADDVSVTRTIAMSVDTPMDDTPVPVLYAKEQSEATRAENLSKALTSFDVRLAGDLAGQTEMAVGRIVMEKLGEAAFEPLKLPRDQRWLGVGATGYFGAKYAGQLTSLPREWWLNMITREDPRFPVSSAGIDLVHPTDEARMRPQAVDYFRAALNRKAARAVAAWAADPKGGEASITKVLAAVRAKQPADAEALVKLIKDVGGVDLSKELAPR
jgi:hypothetical protein